MLRVNELVKRELGRLCERDIMPQSNTLVTITKVKVTPDLRHATVFVSVFGGPESEGKQVFHRLNRCRRQWQHELSKNVVLKYTPVLQFKPDLTAQNADRVFSILEQLDLPEEEDAP